MSTLPAVALTDALGDELYAALTERRTISPLSTRHPELTIDDAYRISLRMLQRREAAGQRIIGKKIGVTSKPVQEMLNVHQPDFGFLTDTMHYPDRACISLSKAGLIQPRAEGEIAFLLKEDLSGTNITAQDVLDATESVAPCFEIVDSRIENWKIRIQDTVADNASCGVFVIGPTWTPPKGLQLERLFMRMTRNGQPCGEGYGAAVQGHPCTAVAWLANTLGRYGIPFRKGEIILSGSLAALVPAVAGDQFEMHITELGNASVSFTD